MVPRAVNTGTWPYTTNCHIDSIEGTALTLQNLTEPATIKLCEFTGLPHEPHMLVFDFFLDTEVIEPSGAIYFDYIEYLPAISATPQTFNLIAVSSDDEAMMYDNTWSYMELDDGTVGMTGGIVAENSTVQLQFDGPSMQELFSGEPC